MRQTPMLRRVRPVLALSLLLSVGGCQAPVPVVPATTDAAATTPGAAPDASAPAQSPAGPAASAPLAVSGTAVLPSGPMAGATVTAYLMGKEPRTLGTATTDADGKFSLSLDAAGAGKLVRLVAVKGDQKLIAVTLPDDQPAAKLRVQALGDSAAVQLDIGTSIAYMALASRWELLAQTAAARGDLATATAAYRLSAQAASSAATLLAKAEIDLVLTAPSATGTGSLSSNLAYHLAPPGGTLTLALLTTSDTLVKAIQARIAAGDQLPTQASLTSSVVFGSVYDSPVLGVSRGSGGSASGPVFVAGQVGITAMPGGYIPAADVTTESWANKGSGMFQRAFVLLGDDPRPVAIAASAYDQVAWIANQRVGLLSRVTKTGLVTSVRVGVAADETAVEPTALAVEPSNGSVWVVGKADNSLTHVAHDGTIINTFTDDLDAPVAVVVDPVDKSVWVANIGDSTLLHMQADGTDPQIVPVPGAPKQLVLTAFDRSVYVECEGPTSNQSAIAQVSKTNTVIRSFLDYGVSHLAADPVSGGLYVSLNGNMKYYAGNTTGTTFSYIFSPGGPFKAIAADPSDGSVWCVYGYYANSDLYAINVGQDGGIRGSNFVPANATQGAVMAYVRSLGAPIVGLSAPLSRTDSAKVAAYLNSVSSDATVAPVGGDNVTGIAVDAGSGTVWTINKDGGTVSVVSYPKND